MFKRVPGAAVAAAAVLVSGAVLAAAPPLPSPQSQSFTVQLTISPECKVDVIPTLDFTPPGGVGFIETALTEETTISIGCTKDTVATVSLNNGVNFSGTRRMSNGTDFISYDLFTAGDYGTVWNTTNTRTVTGSGAVSGGGSPVFDQTLTVFGRVPSQNTGSTGTYSDTIIAEVSF